jgi:diguanylate cyclase (GGDEF)-like protein
MDVPGGQLSVVPESRWPKWRVIAVTTAVCGGIAAGSAAVQVASRGVTRPAIFVGGTLATIFVNSIYVFVMRRGVVREAIDLSEAPIVALALLLPPGEALLAFTLGSMVVETVRDRAAIKKVFNVSVRTTAASCMLLAASHAHWTADLTATRTVAVIAGAAVYTVVSALLVGMLVASIEQVPVIELMSADAGARAVVWASAVAIGITGARVAIHAPWALTGVVASLLVIGLTAQACTRAQRDRERLQHVLDATIAIQAATGEREQQEVLLRTARDLLFWRDVTLRDTPPEAGEAGARVSFDGREERWLVAVPGRDADPWNEEDDRILRTLTGAAGFALDRARMRDELSRQALIDPLTGVANRRSFDAGLQALLAPPSLGRVAVLLIDLDNFKAVNDQLGHEVGDHLLRVVAQRLTGAVRSRDVVARLGGDEFVVALDGVPDRETAWRLASKVQLALDEPVELAGWRLAPAGSVGLAIAPEDGTTAQALLRAADRSMYRTKQERARLRPDFVAVAVAGGGAGREAG